MRQFSNRFIWRIILPLVIFTFILAACSDLPAEARCAPEDAEVYSVFVAGEVLAQTDVAGFLRDEMNKAQAEHPTGEVENCTNNDDGPNPGGLVVYVIR